MILTKIKNNLVNLLQYLINFGINNTTKKTEVKRIKLLNIFCWLWYLRCIVQLSSELLGMNQNSDFLFTFFDFFAFLTNIFVIQVLQYHKKYKAARFLFIFSIMFFCFFYSVFMYPGKNIELNYILIPGATLILLNNKKTIGLVFLSSFIVLFAIYILLSSLHNIQYNYLSIAIIYSYVAIMINYFKNLNLKSELGLKEKTIELVALDKFKSHFFTNISHEIRTPLTLIKGEIDVLKDDNLTKAKINLIHNNANTQISNITTIVNTVMDLAKMKSSNFSLNTKVTNIIPLIKKVHLNFESIFNQKNIALFFKTLSQEYFVNIDAIFIERTLNNILNNAFKYTEKGSVTIKIKTNNNFLQISICDTGIGISSKNQKNIFKSFYQVDNDINKSGGSGIGLAFSKEIIKLHHGEITIKSTENEGSCFTISLPLVHINTLNVEKKTIEEVKVSLINKTVSTSLTFLIIDDNKEMRNYLKSILIKNNCILALNGIQALDILKSNDIDFIITDYMMPKMNGLDFCKKLNQLNIDIPVIMLTAKTDMESKLEILTLGVKDYITKPFNKNELLVRIQNLVKNQTKKNEYNKNIQIEPITNFDLLSKIENHINTNSNNKELTLEFLSTKFKTSKSSLYRHIKSKTGLSPKEYITEVRLQKARRILEDNPDILLKQVSLEVGFQRTSYFSKLYAERFGHKPK